MREQEAGRQRGLPTFAPHADDGAPCCVWVVVNQPQQVFLPIEQFELLPDVLSLRHEADRLDKGDDVGCSDLVVTQLFLLAPGHGALISQGRDSEA